MLFTDLINRALSGVEYTVYPKEIKNVNITGIAADSRSTEEGFLFAAIPGFKRDGKDYIDDALSSGIIGIITEESDVFCRELSTKVTVIRVKNTRQAYALISKELNYRLDEEFEIIGVTGTNGKTSVTSIISHIFNTCGKKAATIGTLGGVSPDGVIHSLRTTPDIGTLYSILGQYKLNGVEAVAMEVSSHALALDRVSGFKFKYAVFTNLTKDHLDFHNTVEEYKKAKQKLFYLSENAIINIDDKFGAELSKHIPCNTVTYSAENKNADYFASDIVHTDSFTEFNIKIKQKEKYSIKTITPGLFSVYNSLAAFAVSCEYGFSPEDTASALKAMPAVSGRFEKISNTLGINIILDYAHTPDGIQNVLSTARKITRGKLISVFGCGGDREKTKRSEMGRISGDIADYTVITSDNPRSENEITIAYEIASLFSLTRSGMYNIIIDRANAIRHAILCSHPGDTVIVMGKGHEEYQEAGGIRYPFSDRDVINKILRERK